MQLGVAHGLAGHLVPGHIAGTLLPGTGQFTFPPWIVLSACLEILLKFFIVLVLNELIFQMYLKTCMPDRMN